MAKSHPGNRDIPKKANATRNKSTERGGKTPTPKGGKYHTPMNKAKEKG